MSDHIESRVASFCQHIGADHAWETTNGSHRRLTVTHGERKAVVIVASTSVNRRNAENALRDIRHGLGLVGGKRVGERRERKAFAPEPLPPMPVLTMKEDRFTPALAIIAERMRGQQRQTEEAMQTIQTPIAPKVETRIPRGEKTRRIRNLLLSGATVAAVMEATGAARTLVHQERWILMRDGRLESVIPAIRRKHAKARREAQKAAKQSMAAEAPAPGLRRLPDAPTAIPPAYMLPTQPLLRWPAVAVFAGGVGVAVLALAINIVRTI